ncbi:MAG: helix-turn-helix domain-containing protein [Solirubrobacterales bacterium]
MTAATSPGRAPGSRERILEAARAVLAREGYAGTTMRAIGREAGVAVGLANYHFNSRRELLADVIATSRSHFLGLAETRVPDAPGPQTLRRILEMTRGLVDVMPDWYRVGADLDAQALRDDDLAALAAANKDRGQADARAYFETVCRAFDVPPPEDVEGISAALLAAFDGLAVRALIDRDFDAVPAFKALERMSVATLAPEQSPVGDEWDLDPLSGGDAPGSERADR